MAEDNCHSVTVSVQCDTRNHAIAVARAIEEVVGRANATLDDLEIEDDTTFEVLYLDDGEVVDGN